MRQTLGSKKGASATASSSDSMASEGGSGGPLRLRFENVIRQGVLTKKGTILKLYNNECMFYLEKKGEVKEGSGLFAGPFLKYGHKKKQVSHSIDLGSQSVRVIRVPNNKTKFQIVTHDQKLKLKALS